MNEPITFVSFGHGSLIVDTGSVDEHPAVFIWPAKEPGVVGQPAADSEYDPDNFPVANTVVLMFPTKDQVDLVVEALCDPSLPQGLDDLNEDMDLLVAITQEALGLLKEAQQLFESESITSSTTRSIDALLEKIA